MSRLMGVLALLAAAGSAARWMTVPDPGRLPQGVVSPRRDYRVALGTMPWSPRGLKSPVAEAWARRGTVLKGTRSPPAASLIVPQHRVCRAQASAWEQVAAARSTHCQPVP